jgi:hypothetical protein
MHDRVAGRDRRRLGDPKIELARIGHEARRLEQAAPPRDLVLVVAELRDGR